MKFIVLYILIALTFISCNSTKKQNQIIQKKHSAAALKKDIALVKQSLEETHPGLYWYVTKPTLDFKFDSLKNAITDSLNSIQFYRMLAPLVTAVKCGHTRLVYPGITLNKIQKDSIKKAGQPALTQLNYFISSNQVYIRSKKVKGLDSLKIGDEILSINGLAIHEILAKQKSLFASDGENQTFQKEILNGSFANYYYLAYGKKDSLLLNIKRDSTIFNYTLKTVKPVSKKGEKPNKEELIEQKKLAKTKKQFERKNAYKGFDADKKPLLDFKIDSTLKSTAIVKVKDFSFEKSNFNKFFKESFREIEQKNIENVILDLRDNGGGKLMACNLLFRYLYSEKHRFTGRSDMNARTFKALKYKEQSKVSKISNIIFYPTIWLGNHIIIRKDSAGYYSKLPTDRLLKPKKYVFNGNLIAIINGHSFSATSLLSANLQSVNRGTFIGEETGGGYNKCTAGNIPYIILPESHLRLRLPLKVIPIVKQRVLEGRGVFPDVEVKMSSKDVLVKEDVILEQAKNMISN
ncbi:S41 family peptidase [Pedobacter alpinus]|uniref:S41 family peptidase n=1 Tax=Pedobacter alpinus TaxID=1590643 RepID=A0ABW5TQ59_9SPHI